MTKTATGVKKLADFTRKAIKDTFMALLEKYPLSEITIKRIVSECGINRNTFYYHYQDLPDLIDEMIKEETESIIAKYPTVSTILECFDAITEFASNKERAIMHIYRSVNREVFERHLMNVCEYFVAEYVDTVLTGTAIKDADRKTVINYYKCVCFGLVLEWLELGMQEEYARDIRRIFLLKHNFAAEFAQLLNDLDI